MTDANIDFTPIIGGITTVAMVGIAGEVVRRVRDIDKPHLSAKHHHKGSHNLI